MKKLAYLLHIDYAPSASEAILRLLLKDVKTNKVFKLYDRDFKPYFYLLPSSSHGITEAKKKVMEIVAFDQGREARVQNVEIVERKVHGKEEKLLKIYVPNPSDVPKLAEQTRNFGENFEHQIPFIQRYLLDNKLQPCGVAEVEFQGEKLESISAAKGSFPFIPLRLLAMDIETYNPNVVSNPKKDPCLMISYATTNSGGAPGDALGDAGVLSFAKKFSHDFVESFSTEREMLEKFCELVREKHADVICTYNGDQFDLPFLRERAKILNADFRLGRDKSLPKSKKRGLRIATSLAGRIHFDAYPVVGFLNFIGALKLNRQRLQDAYAAISGKEKADIKKIDIHKIWDSAKPGHGNKELDHLAFYNRDDSLACLAISQYALPLEIEMSRLTGNLLFDTSRATAMPLVEPFLMKRALSRGEVIPSKPSHSDVEQRGEVPVEGAFVKLPNPGVYENIAVLDFKSLYPSIIISKNVGPDSLNCKCCGEKSFVSPQGHRFCKKHKSIIADMLGEVLDTRFAVQREMKQITDKNSDEYKQLYARQWSLKILANSTYGLLLNARFRWYTREGGESTTAWAREYIQDTIRKAEEAGFNVLYSDTDSIFLQHDGDEKKVEHFRQSVNKALPERMELEMEDFYPRGIFVSKRTEGKGAKKKYALINREGKIKIRGFELVRRDWSKIARSTQRTVLEILLKEGDVKKALLLVRKTVADLREGKVNLDDLTIWTQLRKSPKDYQIMSPEISAFLKAQKAGLQVTENLVGYVVTSNGKTISEKAQVREMAKDYDADYYINKQILPAVLKILSELGVEEDDILTNSKQHTLGGW